MRVCRTVLASGLLLAAASLAQNSPTPLRWTEGAPNATIETENNTKIEGLKTDNVHIFVSLADIHQTEYNRVWVQISNHGTSPLAFDPQATELINEKDKVLHPEIPAKAGNSIQKFGEAKSQELSSAHCDMMTATQCQPTDAQMQMSKQVLAYSGKQAEWVRDNGLVQKSIAPGEEAQGAIIFKKEKKKANYTLKVPVGGQIFEFPLTAQNKAPSYD
jgi:hypothetical protein